VIIVYTEILPYHPMSKTPVHPLAVSCMQKLTWDEGRGFILCEIASVSEACLDNYYYCIGND